MTIVAVLERHRHNDVVDTVLENYLNETLERTAQTYTQHSTRFCSQQGGLPC